MSLDESYMENGTWNPRRNPIAYQIAKAGTTESDHLARAVAALEDELTKLRGSGPNPAESLIHHDEKTDNELRALSPEV